MEKRIFFTKFQKTGNGNICILSHNFETNSDSNLLITSKRLSEPLLCEKCSYSWQQRPEVVIKWPFVIMFRFETVYMKPQSNLDLTEDTKKTFGN